MLGWRIDNSAIIERGIYVKLVDQKHPITVGLSELGESGRNSWALRFYMCAFVLFVSVASLTALSIDFLVDPW